MLQCPKSIFLIVLLSSFMLCIYPEHITVVNISPASSRRFARRVLLTFPLSHFQSFWVHLEISEQNKGYCLNKTHDNRYIESVLESHDFRGLSATNFILVLKNALSF